ncbi:class II histone deacetylase [Microbacterium aurum]
MNTGYVWHELYGWWDMGSGGLAPADPRMGLQPLAHWAHPDTKRRLHELVAVSGIIESLTRISPRKATEEELLRVHLPEHVHRIQRESDAPKGGDAGDGNSPFGAGGYEIARLSAGGAIALVEAVVQGKVDNGYAVINPPGHHARSDHGMGFCVFNNVAVATRHVQRELGVGRVAVVDWDVHHGNGTQQIFWEDPSVLTISIHQERCFPTDSGFVEESGAGRGEGFALNVPLAPGSGHGAYLYAMSQVIVPALRAFKPELIIVASGLDAGIHDPLARQLATSETFAAMTRQILDVAGDVCGGKVAILQEGGYSPHYVPFCGAAIIAELAGIEPLFDPYLAVTAGSRGFDLEPHQRREIDQIVDETRSRYPG